MPDKDGVRPPNLNQLWPIRTVIPAARKLIATPEMSWFPLKVMEASPCRSENSMEAEIPKNSPTHTEPDTEAVAAEKNAAINIFPSNPISNIPALSLNRPARLQNSKGTASLRAESRT